MSSPSKSSAQIAYTVTFAIGSGIVTSVIAVVSPFVALHPSNTLFSGATNPWSPSTNVTTSPLSKYPECATLFSATSL